MPVIHLRLLLVGLSGALIAGCGGGGTTTGNGNGNGGNPTTVTVTFGGTTMPTVVAASIGTGAFTAQTLSGSTLTLSVPSGTSNYAVAYLCPPPFNFGGAFLDEQVWEASTADGTSLSFECSSGSSQGQTGTLTGSLDASAIPGAAEFEIEAPNGTAVQEISQGGSFSLSASDGNDRVLVLVYDSSGQDLLAAKNFTNQTVPGALNGGNTVVFGAADETTPESITYNNVPSGFSSPGTAVDLQIEGVEGIIPLAGATTQYPMLPAGVLESGDFYEFQASTSPSGGNPTVFSASTTNSAGPVSLTFPTPWTYAGPTPAALPTFNFDYTGFSGESGVVYGAGFGWSVGSPLNRYSIGVSATAAYQGGSTTLAIPDLSGVTGFFAAPASGTTVSWNADMQQNSYGVEGTPTVNSTWSTVSNTGSFTVP